MTDPAVHLERLGLEQYLDAFIGEGFDTWETLLDVQESDLEALGVKLGHRRKLQRAIADYRGISYERLVGSPAAQDGLSDSARQTEGSQSAAAGKEGPVAAPAEAKRKYRRHPKPDENAPEKPPSAYVLFSNRVREEVKAESLSFTDIAKLVGDRWQKLDPSQKEPFESQAAALKEQYNVKFSAYKKTDAYRDYSQYLAEFKAKHGPPTEPKRPKLDPQSSGGSVSAASAEAPELYPAVAGHARVGSISSVSAASLTGAMTSPTGSTITQVPSLTNIASAARGLPSLPRPSSPPALQYGRVPRLIGQMSNHSSTSDDSGQVPYDALSRTATLSLSTPPAGTPPLLPHTVSAARSEQGGAGDTYSWPNRLGQPVHQSGSITPSGPSPLGSGITLPSPTFPGEPWRERGMDWTRQTQTPPSTSTAGQAPALPLPPLLGGERMSELSHSQVRRTLPPLRHTASSATSPSTFQGASSTSLLSRQLSAETERRYSQSFEGGGRQLDRSENEAASTLAGLAAGPGQETPLPRSSARRRPG